MSDRAPAADLGDLGHGLAPARVGAADQRRGVGQGDDHGQAVGDDVVQFPGDPGPLGGRRDRRLLVPLELQPPGALVHPGQVAAARGGRHPGEQRGDHGGGEEQQRAGDRAGRLPLHRGHDGPGLQDRGGEQRPGGDSWAATVYRPINNARTAINRHPRTQ